MLVSNSVFSLLDLACKQCLFSHDHNQPKLFQFRILAVQTHLEDQLKKHSLVSFRLRHWRLGNSMGFSGFWMGVGPNADHGTSNGQWSDHKHLP